MRTKDDMTPEQLVATVLAFAMLFKGGPATEAAAEAAARAAKAAAKIILENS